MNALIRAANNQAIAPPRTTGLLSLRTSSDWRTRTVATLLCRRHSTSCVGSLPRPRRGRCIPHGPHCPSDTEVGDI
jgi:hypothetical protein